MKYIRRFAVCLRYMPAEQFVGELEEMNLLLLLMEWGMKR